jgi:hypothetical protein
MERERERERERWLFFITKAGGFCHEANMSRDCCLRNISSHMWIIWFTLNLPCEASFSCFSGAFAKLRNATITIIMSVCLSVRMQQLGSYCTDFDDILYLNFFGNLSVKFKFN